METWVYVYGWGGRLRGGRIKKGPSTLGAAAAADVAKGVRTQGGGMKKGVDGGLIQSNTRRHQKKKDGRKEGADGAKRPITVF